MVWQKSSTAIMAWSAVSPMGIGRLAFTDGVITGRATAKPPDREQWPVPLDQICLVEDFSPRAALGGKGTRSMDRVTGLAVTAVGQLLCEVDGIGGRDDTALVLGTSTGSAQSIMDFTRDSVVQAKPYFVDPTRFPNTVMNCAAGQSAIWYGLRGPNTTVSAGRVSGLHALNYGRRLHETGRAAAVLCGAVEEFSVARSWLEWHSAGPGQRQHCMGEGCAILLLERVADGQPLAGADAGSATAERAPLATILGLRFGVFHTVEDSAALLATLVMRLMRECAIDQEDIAVVASSRVPGRLGDAEQSALDQAVGSGPCQRRIAVADLIGDTAAASASFQVAAMLAMAQHDAGVSGRVGLVTAMDRDGTAGCALLRLH